MFSYIISFVHQFIIIHLNKAFLKLSQQTSVREYDLEWFNKGVFTRLHV